MIGYLTWNDKYLDYEIETKKGDLRLRHLANLKRQVPRLRDWNPTTQDWSEIVSDPTWNDKYLDYEIETFTVLLWRKGDFLLETTSTSITRLKHICHEVLGYSYKNLKRQVPRLRDWNYACGLDTGFNTGTWNDKYLDYEIETSIARIPSSGSPASLKRQVPRLRDWNIEVTRWSE